MSTNSRVAIDLWRKSYATPTTPNLEPCHFFNITITLFREVLQVAKTSNASVFPLELFPNYLAELQRFYLWGDGFDVSEAGPLLYIDLCRLLGTTSPSSGSLRAAIDEVVEAESTLASLFPSVSGQQTANTACELDYNSPELTANAAEVLANITSYIDCLVDLGDALESPVQDLIEDQLPASEPETFDVLPEADVYCRRIRDQFPLLPKYLVERLGCLNAERYYCLRSLHEEVSESVAAEGSRGKSNESCFSKETPSESLLSKANTTTATEMTRISSVFDQAIPELPSCPEPTSAEQDHALDSVSISSYGTTKSTINHGKTRVPPLPNEAHDGKSFTCTVCCASISGLKPGLSGKCDCATKGSVKMYGSFKAWVQKQEQNHTEQWADQQCPFCPVGPWRDHSMRFFKHIGKHLQGIALAALPQIYFEGDDDHDDSCDESEEEIMQEQQQQVPDDKLDMNTQTEPAVVAAQNPVKSGGSLQKGLGVSQPNSKQTNSHGSSYSRFLVCPFYIWDPITYHNCGGKIMRHNSDFQPHFHRCHGKPLFCPVCKVIFKGKEAPTNRNAHIKDRRCY
ncbi:hypothetical protein QBC38DRAFT_548323 [Podospora fimiseda]|uniref:Uncharacterized protein n=1 Tax=Podospora fimiseda TaxID=252190 RepID=A0AAN7GP69_9PEZI|nr:hypothetical protein QBC38DRAFT_548323 [Podospora fimiseda]